MGTVGEYPLCGRNITRHGSLVEHGIFRRLRRTPDTSNSGKNRQ